ncbi:MAG: ribosome small subunit-dependent GTPase A [Bacteroidetes bacterium]|nr:ribosome small subunit-dependent GTPase A [Bacteroidota bacterium]
MTPEELGYNNKFEAFRIEHHLSNFEVGRVVAEHKERYKVRTASGEYEAEITGNMRFTALSREDFPAVGDWVALTTFDSGPAIIHEIFPRFSLIKRQAAGQTGEIQLIAANIDFAFLMQAVDRDFSINRLERYLTICHASNVLPIIVLSKTDLIGAQQLEELQNLIKARIPEILVIAISNSTREGYVILNNMIKKGKTYCMLGSSGVGKSTLMNNLAGRNLMKTGLISGITNKGRHITTHRELMVLESGGILVDNPGMREVGIADTASGLETTFDRIISLAQQCRFSDCRHTSMKGCAVLQAVEAGEIDQGTLDNYLRLERERAHHEATAETRRMKDKAFGKMKKNYKKGNHHLDG